LKIIEYLVPLGEGARKRHYHESDKGRLAEFVVQLEVLVDDHWDTVIRYDSAHGFPHIDRYYRDGKKTKKPLYLEFDEALILADEDIKENWKKYQRAFMEGN